MDTVKRKSRLAVFEHVDSAKPKRVKKFRPNQLPDPDTESSHSESELVIDFEELRPKSGKKAQAQKVRVKSELLHLKCQWDDCEEPFNSYESYNEHFINHMIVVNKSEEYTCLWKDCSLANQIPSIDVLMRHISYHGYISKLKNIGANVVIRNKLPPCSLLPTQDLDISDGLYVCEWEHCTFSFNAIYDFLRHIEVHVRNNPTGKVPTNEVIRCDWTGCKIKFSTQYKLMEHVRVHTKEKVVACPTCGSLFSNKTKFSDHRNRQLKANLRSYQCSQCLKLFPSERILSDHMRAHINQYKCTMCDMTCAKPGMLATHIRFKHLNERPFECSQCGKKFVTKHNLFNHFTVHQKNPMKCELCDFGCKSKVGLDNHYVKSHRLKSPIYECHECSRIFQRGYNLTKHLFRVHKFHWPSGHSRFRYRKGQDGVYRLQTVRYESLEVTNELIKSESMPSQANIPEVSYNISYGSNKEQHLADNIPQIAGDSKHELDSAVISQQVCNNILITIDDLDEHGNVVNSRVIESYEILVDDEENDEFLDEGCDPKRQEEDVDVKKEKEEKPERTEDGIHYFTREIILNSDDIKIKTPK